MKKISPLFRKALEILWAAALISLPVTSFPLFTRLTRSLVAPLAGLPVLLLCLTWLVPYLLRRGKVPVETKPFLLFVWISLIASAGAFFIQIPSFKEATILGQELRAYVTVATGASFYLLFATWPVDAARLQRALRWVSLGGILMLLWSLTQVNYLLSGAAQFPGWVTAIQKMFVVETGFFFRWTNRLSAMTYEPSWFTYLMTILYFPLWLSASLTRNSSIKLKIGGVILEDGLLILALLEFLLSAPRISLVSLGTMAVFVALPLHTRLVTGITQVIDKARKMNISSAHPNNRRWLRLSISICLLLGYAGSITSAGYILVKRDDRMQRIFQNTPAPKDIAGLFTLDEASWLRVGLRLAFFERVNYWFFGLHVFERYPWLGVGLGNAGFFYQEALPAVGWESYETRGIMFSAGSIPNVKNLWIRLLAESGFAGFAAYCFWLYILWRSTSGLRQSSQPVLHQVALLGQLSLVAMIAEGFSIDSFAMPYVWVVAGLISAAAMIYRQNISEDRM